MVEDVNDYVPVIQEDPTSLAFSFDAQGMKALFSQLLFNMGGDCLDLPVRISAANHEVVGKRREILNLQDDQVYGLVVQRRPDAKESVFSGTRFYRNILFQPPPLLTPRALNRAGTG